jgi:hypothetical protein
MEKQAFYNDCHKYSTTQHHLLRHKLEVYGADYNIQQLHLTLSLGYYTDFEMHINIYYQR